MQFKTKAEQIAHGLIQSAAIYETLWHDLQIFDRHLRPELRPSWGIIFGVVNNKVE